MCRVDGIILAAGLSRRMGKNKLLLPLGDSTVISRLLERIPYPLFQEVFLVFSDQRVHTLAAQFPVTPCLNREPLAGKSHSIRLGLRGSRAEDGLMFFVADQPLLKRSTITRLLATFCANTAKIVVPEVDGMARNPVIFPTDCRQALQALHGDQGGRGILQDNHDRVCAIPWSCGEEFCDIDTPEDYQQVAARCS